jgi:hypothetical protein
MDLSLDFLETIVIHHSIGANSSPGGFLYINLMMEQLIHGLEAAAVCRHRDRMRLSKFTVLFRESNFGMIS